MRRQSAGVRNRPSPSIMTRMSDARLAASEIRLCPEGEPVFVRLHDLAPDTAGDAPIPEVEALVRDRPELIGQLQGICEFERDGQRFVGLLIADAVPPNGAVLLKALDRLVTGPSWSTANSRRRPQKSAPGSAPASMAEVALLLARFLLLGPSL